MPFLQAECMDLFCVELFKSIPYRLRLGSFDYFPGFQVQLYRFPIPADVSIKFPRKLGFQIVKQLNVGEFFSTQD